MSLEGELEARSIECFLSAVNDEALFFLFTPLVKRWSQLRVTTVDPNAVDEPHGKHHHDQKGASVRDEG